jgi:hypothetical protein
MRTNSDFEEILLAFNAAGVSYLDREAEGATRT